MNTRPEYMPKSWKAYTYLKDTTYFTCDTCGERAILFFEKVPGAKTLDRCSIMTLDHRSIFTCAGWGCVKVVAAYMEKNK